MVDRWRGRYNWVDVSLICLLASVAIAHAWIYRFDTIDDAYITYRYAENIATGQGFVFNPGEHVEGTSTFLFTLILAVTKLLGFDIESGSRCISVAAFAVLVLLVYDYVRTTTEHRVSRALAVGSSLLVVSSTSLAFFAALGMELTLFIVLLTAGIFEYLRNMADEREGRRFMLWLALAATTRTEGAAVAMTIVGLCAFDLVWSRATRRKLETRAQRAAVRRMARAVIWLAVILVPLYVFRWLYFGTLVPNSVLAKSGTFKGLCVLPFTTALERISHGNAIAMLRHFADERLGLLVYALPFGWLSSRYRRQTTLFAAVCTLLVAVLIWNDGDWMPHTRLLAPAIPLISVGLAVSVSTLEVFLRHARTRRWIQFLVAITIFAYSVDHAFYERALKRTQNVTTKYMCELGKALAETSSASELLATDMAGRVPYFSKIRTLDVFGLNDAHIARFGSPLLHMGKTDFAYVYPKRPDYYFYNIRNNIRYMYDNEDFRPYVHDYWLVMTPFFRAQHGARGKVLLVRKDLSRLNELVRRLSATLVDPQTYR